VLHGLDLFSGIGGIARALRPWVRTVAYVEREPWCQAVLWERIRAGDLDVAPLWDDVTTFDPRPFAGAVDIVSGGFPCQDISTAGRGAGLAGERSGLFFQITRIVRVVRPAFIYLENVPAITAGGAADGMSSQRLPRWGSSAGGVCFRLSMWARRTFAKGGGVWPTPSANGERPNRDIPHRLATGRQITLSEKVRLWPTPNVPNGGQVNPPGTSATGRTPDGRRRQVGLEQAVKLWPNGRGDLKLSSAVLVSLLPTPAAREGHAQQLPERIGGQLNPTWVEWLMGFPPGWTACGDWAIPWCRSARRKLSSGS
jgi:hypothetical protein